MSSPRLCTRCGAELDRHGLCPACLLAVAVDAGPASSPATEAPPPAPAELAEHFPSYEILDFVGRGGMGFVYRARHRTLERQVALKLLAPQVAAQPGFAERFAREARVLASLSHPSIVAVHDHGRAGPWWHLALEFVEGASLRELMRQRSIEPRQALAIVAQICGALEYAHERGVVHRDIKPENILVDRAGRVRILDFGLSKFSGERAGENLTRTDQVMGTPHYMAPEQWERPAEVDHRADIYSVGVVFYELLTGELPLGRFEPPSHRAAIDVRLDEVVLKSLEKAPERRYQHASEVKSRVEEMSHTTSASPPVAPAASAAGGQAQRRAPAASTASSARSEAHRSGRVDEDLIDAILGRPLEGARPARSREERGKSPLPLEIKLVALLLALLLIALVIAILAAASGPSPIAPIQLRFQ